MANDYVSVEVKGLDELQKRFEELPKQVARKGLRAALRAGANVFKKAMVANAPKGSGFMSEHIGTKSRIAKDELAGTIFVGPNTKPVYPNRKPEWGARAAALVARWIEFGSRGRIRNPFLTASFEGEKQNALNTVVEKLKDALGL